MRNIGYVLGLTIIGMSTSGFAGEPVRLDDAALERVTAGVRNVLSSSSGSASSIAIGGLSSASTRIELSTRVGGSRSSSGSTAYATTPKVVIRD